MWLIKTFNLIIKQCYVIVKCREKTGSKSPKVVKTKNDEWWKKDGFIKLRFAVCKQEASEIISSFEKKLNKILVVGFIWF